MVLVQVRIAASLPCYSPENVDEQRGAGVYERSIKACSPPPPSLPAHSNCLGFVSPVNELNSRVGATNLESHEFSSCSPLERITYQCIPDIPMIPPYLH